MPGSMPWRSLTTSSPSSTISASARVPTRAAISTRSPSSEWSEWPVRATSIAALSSSNPLPSTATVSMTGTPSRSSSRSRSMASPRLRASSAMLSATTMPLAHVDELQRQEQVALEVHGVDHVDDHVAGHDDVARDALFVVEARHAVDAGGVDDVDLAEAAASQLDGRAREVRDVDVGAGERGEHHGLAYVGVACENHRVDAFAGVGAGGVAVAKRVGALRLGCARHRTSVRGGACAPGCGLRASGPPRSPGDRCEARSVRPGCG